MTLANRYEFVLLFDVRNGNPNGDPDAGNMPRIDPETYHGLVSDVSLKRKIRNYVSLKFDGDLTDIDRPLTELGKRHEIFVTERAILDTKQLRAWRANSIAPQKEGDYGKLPKEEKEARILKDWMCANFFDIRTFGAVMSTKGANCGQVRGPVQLSFAESIEAINPSEISITRMAATTEDESKGDIRTMGRKHIVPYGLYRAHGYISAKLAAQTGFSDADLDLLFEALGSMFEHDRSAARGEMSTCRLIAFKHASALGNAPAKSLFDRVRVGRQRGGDVVPIGDPRLDNAPPARGFADYAVEIDRGGLPDGVEVIERV